MMLMKLTASRCPFPAFIRWRRHFEFSNFGAKTVVKPDVKPGTGHSAAAIQWMSSLG